MEIRVKMTVSTHMSLSSEAASEVSSLTSSFLLLRFVFSPFCCLFLVWKGYGWKGNKTTCNTKPKTQQDCISLLNSETKALQNAVFEFVNSSFSP